jgi:hypothetical protein
MSLQAEPGALSEPIRPRVTRSLRTASVKRPLRPLPEKNPTKEK